MWATSEAEGPYIRACTHVVDGERGCRRPARKCQRHMEHINGVMSCTTSTCIYLEIARDNHHRARLLHGDVASGHSCGASCQQRRDLRPGRSAASGWWSSSASTSSQIGGSDLLDQHMFVQSISDASVTGLFLPSDHVPRRQQCCRGGLFVLRRFAHFPDSFGGIRWNQLKSEGMHICVEVSGALPEREARRRANG